MSKQIWSIVEKNRWTVIMPILGILLWIYAGVSCTPQTESPIRQGVMVNAIELQQDFETWKSNCELTGKRFNWATDDIKTQEERWTKIEAALMTVSTGGVTSWTGLLSLFMGSGIVGLFADNIRKNGVIGGLKRNKVAA